MSEPLPRLYLPASPQLRTQLLRLRFEGTLEPEFRADYEAGAVHARILLHVLGILMIAATPLYDGLLLHMPAAFWFTARVLQFGVQIPAVVVSLVLAAHAPWRRYSPHVLVMATVIVSAGLAAQRVLGAPYGFEVPQTLSALAIAATLTVARLRFFFFLPWALLAMVGVSVVELVTFHGAPASVYEVVSSWMLIALAGTGAYLLEHSARWNWYHGRLLEQQAARDALTELPNRRHFDSVLMRLVREAVREQKNVALLMLDVDDFKAYNDRYGHPAGDECLRRISRWLGDNMRRPQDFCARLGGEEFGAVWFNASVRDAPRLAEDLREGIARLGIPHAAARARRVVTASGGFVQIVAPGPEDAAKAIAAELIERADRALYEAKRTGRSRMVISGSQELEDRETPTQELPPARSES